LGQNWQATPGGYQTLPVTPFVASRNASSWLLNPAFAADWQTFQRQGQLSK
jgi:hypothetical protein